MKIHEPIWLFSWLYSQRILERNTTACYDVFILKKNFPNTFPTLNQVIMLPLILGNILKFRNIPVI